jgi:hypothetical protein
MNTERQQTVRIEEVSRGAFLERNVLGLNIFWANDIECSIGDDPRIAFLSNLCSTNDAGLNIGNLLDYADGPDELFDAAAWEGQYRIVATGCYGGEFYDARKWDTFPSLFFDHVSESFFQITTNGDSLIRKLLQIDAIAYFISPRMPASAEKVVELLNSPFESSETLIEKSLDFCKLIGFSHADGDYFSFASRSKEDFSPLDAPIVSAVNLIESSKWYRENLSTLTWDEGYSECLMKV